MDGATAKTGPASPKETGAKPVTRQNKGEVLSQYIEHLKPKVLADLCEADDVSVLPRPELAVRIGHIVTIETEEDSHNLNLLDRRNLVADLITWLLTSSPKAPAPDRLCPASLDDLANRRKPGPSKSPRKAIAAPMANLLILFAT